MPQLYCPVVSPFCKAIYLRAMNIEFSNASIVLATVNDVGAITSLLNKAYRGESSRAGWTTEADLIAGDVRTDENDVFRTMQKPGSVFLKYMDAQQNVIGCVNLQLHETRLYLGMFSVSPKLQGVGIGRQLLEAAECFAKEINCNTIYMSVISAREELIAWYQRNGYQFTGERMMFEEDGLSGKHLQPLEFVFLEKTIP